MGVPGLWDLLRPAATRTSLSTLAREGFLTNRNNLRAYTIGIDASLWIFHAQLPQHGENPFLRTIFFKITTLLQQPILPVFVFDGPDKPRLKRGSAVGGRFGTHDRHSIEFKRLLEECGLEYWNAPGEAEAELALMNKMGQVDAVLSDDVDALLFGAKCVLRNNSPTLTGSKGGDLRTYEVYRSDAIKDAWTAKEGTELKDEEDCRLAMIFIALLSGGDYVPEGLEAFGPTIAFGLAHAGFASTLDDFTTDKQKFIRDMPALQDRIVHELKTNSTKHVGRRYPDRAKKLATRSDALFALSALESYLSPRTSGAWPGFKGETSRRGSARNGGRGDLEGLARACERFFEWGTRELVVKKFAGESVGVFGSEVVNMARRRVLGVQDKVKPDGTITSFFKSTIATPATTNTPEMIKIERTRPDPTNPDLTEYRILYRTEEMARRVQEAMQGSRVDPKLLTPEERMVLGMVPLEHDEEGEGDKEKEKEKDKGQARVWVSEWLVREAWPGMVREWEEAEAAKANKGKAGKKFKSQVKAGTKGKTAQAPGAMITNYFSSQKPPAASGSGSAAASTPKRAAASTPTPETIVEAAEIPTGKGKGRKTPTRRVPPAAASIKAPRVIAKATKPPTRATISQVIDLCSSSEAEQEEQESKTPKSTQSSEEEEEPIERPRYRQSSVLGASSRANQQTGTVATTSAVSTSKSMTRSRQTTLGMPIVKPTNMTASKSDNISPSPPSPKADTPARDSPRRGKGRRSYLVVREDEEEEELDCTRGGRNLAGYGFNS